MVTNAAREERLPRAPRSFVRLATRTALLAFSAITACSDGPTAPGDASYVALLSGANEIPPRSTAGSGTARFDVRTGVATYQVDVANLSAPATLVHLVIGAKDAVGAVIANLPVSAPSGTIATGAIDLRGSITFNNTTISGDSLRTVLENGNAYVNVYTATYPAGEVRGQLARVP
jgi:CHRD domain